MVSINYLDLFSGIGGFAKGLQDAGVSFKNHYFSEIEPNAISIYQKHFPLAKGLGDVKNITNFKQLGTIDLITFGFPCQDLSMAGKRQGLRGERSSLFYEAIRIIKKLRPRYFIFENVKGLFSSDHGADFIRVLQAVSDIGYNGEWQLVNTSWLLPQNRERIYFIGHPRGTPRPKVFPFQDGDTEDFKLQRPKVCCITTNTARRTSGSYIVERQLVQKTKSNPQATRVKTIYGNSVSLMGKGGGLGAETGLYAYPCSCVNRPIRRQNGRRIKNYDEPLFTLTTQDRHGVILIQDETKKGFCEVPPNTGIDLSYPNSNTRRGRIMKDIAHTVTTGKNNLCWYDGVSIRRLTPLECERLQGFNDNWTQFGHDGRVISETARYETIGNAVSCPIVEMIAKRLFF